MRDPLTDDGNVQASQQWTINGGPPPGQQWWATTGPSSIPPLAGLVRSYRVETAGRMDGHD